MATLTMEKDNRKIERSPVGVVLKDFEIKLMSRKVSNAADEGHQFGTASENLVQKINLEIDGGTMFGILGGSGKLQCLKLHFKLHRLYIDHMCRKRENNIIECNRQ